MKCANCGAELKLGCVYCSVCGHEAQIVPDYNILEDDFLKSLLDEERKTKEEQEKKKAELERKKKKIEQEKARKKKRLTIIGISVAAVVLIAVVVLLLVNNSHKKSFNYQYQKGMEYLEEGNRTKAIQYLEKASSIDPKNTEVLLQLADIYMLREDDTSAEAALLQVLTLDTQNGAAFERLIELYDSQKEYDKIAELYQKAEEENVKELFDDYLVREPEFSVEAGTYDDTIEIELSAPKGCEIYYTTDGSSPIEDGKKYEEVITLEKEGEYTLKAVSCDERGLYSEIAEAEYEIEYQAPDTVEVSPSAGTYNEPQSITIQVPEGATAYYTWDGSTPSKASSVYTGPLEMPEGNNVLSILIVDSHDLASPVVRFNYVYIPQ